jgi:hypothetical protein
MSLTHSSVAHGIPRAFPRRHRTCRQAARRTPESHRRVRANGARGRADTTTALRPGRPRDVPMPKRSRDDLEATPETGLPRPTDAALAWCLDPTAGEEVAWQEPGSPQEAASSRASCSRGHSWPHAGISGTLARRVRAPRYRAPPARPCRAPCRRRAPARRDADGARRWNRHRSRGAVGDARVPTRVTGRDAACGRATGLLREW